MARARDIPVADRVATLAALHAKINVLLSELTEIDLPQNPPAMWVDRLNRSESPIDFIRREYAPYIGNGLTRAHLRRYDRTLYEALGNWLRKNELPDDLLLPTKVEHNDALLKSALPNLQADPATQQTWRLRHLLEQRNRRNRQEPV